MTEANQTSRVLTLVFTDLADSTALKTERGDVAVGDLIARHRDHVTRLAQECAGRIIDWAGDGCFLTFDTSSAGVMFALRLQQAHKADTDLPGVRIGIHMGEVTEKDGPGGTVRVEGLAVDIAARISGLASPGQVLMSSSIYQSARQRLGVDAFGQPVLWQSHGAYALKGFDDPIDIGEAGLEGLSPLLAPAASEKARPISAQIAPSVPSAGPRNRAPMALALGAALVLLVIGTGLILRDTPNEQEQPGPGAGLSDTAPITSLAVLPLDNLSGDPEQDYFADGMTEAIIAELAKIKALSVVSRTSAMRYKNSPLSLPEIAAELGVEGLIEGSVLRDGDEIRITVQLIDGRTDDHVWSESYLDTITSVLKLQARVALTIAQEISATITPEEKQQYAVRDDVDDQAYDAYLKAWELMMDGTEDSAERALRYLEQAQEIDSDMADAWGAEARAHWVLAIYANRPMRDQIEKVRAAASRALALDENQFYGHIGMGSYAQVRDHDWDTAIRHYERAVELNPSEPIARFYLGNLQVLLGDWETGLRQAEEIIRLSAPASYERALASVMFTQTNLDERAIAMFDNVEPTDFPGSPWQLARIYYRADETDKAIRLSELADDAGVRILALARSGRREEALDLIGEINEAGVDRARARVRLPDIAAAFIWLEDVDTAYQWLERAYADSSIWLLGVLREAYLDDRINDPRWVAFRNDPRYWTFIERLKLPPLPPEHPGYADEQAWLARKAEREAANAPIEKIAVLPFDNMSSEVEQEFFVDGMTEALIAELAKIKSIKVISRTSVMQYKGDDRPSLPEIARALGVDALVEGSVMKAGNEVRITAQLVNGRTDEHLWADSYINTLENVFKLQAEVALAITDEINATVTADERARIASAKTVDPRVFELYTQARHLWSQRQPDDLRTAQRLFEQALEIDPDFALGHVGLADTYFILSAQSEMPTSEGVSMTRVHLERALELDPNLGEAYVTRGILRHTNEWNWQGAEEDFRRGIALNPNHATAWHWLGILLRSWGRFDEAVEALENAYELDPASPVIGYVLGWHYALAGRIHEAVAQVDRNLELYPNHSGVLSSSARIYQRAGRAPEARTLLERSLSIDPNRALGVLLLARYLAREGESTEARALIESVLSDPDAGELQNTAFAIAYAALGDADEAIRLLEASAERRETNLAFIGTDPDYEPIRDDPRFQAIMRQINHPLAKPQAN